MDRLAICRICLNANVSHQIPDTQLQEVYENLTSMPFQNTMKSSLVCYMCNAQLYKVHRLKLQCLKVEELLTQIRNQLANRDGVQQESIEIDGTDITPFTCTAVQHIHIEPYPRVKDTTHIKYEEDVDVKTEVEKEDWNIPGTSQRVAAAPALSPIEGYTPLSPAALSPLLIELTEAHPPSAPIGPVDKEWTLPPHKKNTFMEAFIESDRKAREYARERDRTYEELEREHLQLSNEQLKVKEFEIRERVRQRDAELQLQAKWLKFMEECMNVFNKYMEKK